MNGRGGEQDCGEQGAANERLTIHAGHLWIVLGFFTGGAGLNIHRKVQKHLGQPNGRY
ncbi:hypothetical protein STUTZSP0542_37570 [Stutzerimonas marianensis]